MSDRQLRSRGPPNVAAGDMGMPADMWDGAAAAAPDDGDDDASGAVIAYDPAHGGRMVTANDVKDARRVCQDISDGTADPHDVAQFVRKLAAFCPHICSEGYVDNRLQTVQHELVEVINTAIDYQARGWNEASANFANQLTTNVQMMGATMMHQLQQSTNAELSAHAQKVCADIAKLETAAGAAMVQLRQDTEAQNANAVLQMQRFVVNQNEQLTVAYHESVDVRRRRPRVGYSLRGPHGL